MKRHLKQCEISRKNQASVQENAHINLTIPPFWRDVPRLWFIWFEAATIHLQKSQTQLAQMVIALLEKQDIEKVCDVLYNPPAIKQYNTLKDRLISAYETSDSRRLHTLLLQIELGDQKPSQLLQEMRILAQDKVSDSTLRVMWTNHLPLYVQSVLEVSETFTIQPKLDEIALLADKIIENSNRSHISTVEGTSAKANVNQILREEIQKLSFEVAVLKMSHQICNQQHYNLRKQQYRRTFFRRDRSVRKIRNISKVRSHSGEKNKNMAGNTNIDMDLCMDIDVDMNLDVDMDMNMDID